jgi:membrane protein DedA with SNARE-associated domain
MTATEFLETYGYAAVLAGALMQAEIVLLLAGFAAHRGLLSLELVLLLGALGGAAGAQGFFWVGRRWGGLLRHAPRIQGPMLRMVPLLRRWDAALVVGVRFLYGLRIAGPIAMGALGVDARRFAGFNAVGAVVWSVVFVELGYLLGHGIEVLLRRLEGYESVALWSTAGVITLLAVGRRVRHAWHARRRDAADS